MLYRCSAIAALALSGAACASTPTYHQDVAPLLAQHCANCHQPGQAAPFSLQTYVEVRARASLIDAAVGSGRMPPWLPDPSEPRFVGERRLTGEQIAVVQRWARGGAPEGTPAAGGAARPPATLWQAGAPDMVLAPPRAFSLPAGSGHDVYRNLVVNVPGTETRFVRAMEFVTHGAPIHHAVIRIDQRRVSRVRDGVDGQPGFEGMAAHDVQDPDGHFLGWAPGRGAIVAPEGLPWVLPPHSDLVVELHLMPAAKAVDVRPTIGLYFTNQAPKAAPVMIVMGSKAIDIPAGTRNYTVEDRYTLPVDADVLSVYPHAHYLGHRMEVDAVSEGGVTRPLLRIREWSFNWQQDYRFVTPVGLRRGTTLVMRYSYDNSAGNPRNPSRPPRRVLWGPQSHDEMGNLGVQFLARNAADTSELSRSFARHAGEIDARGAEVLAAAQPTVSAHRVLLGTSLMQLGRYQAAVTAFEHAVRLDPGSATAANHLAGALLASGRLNDALTQFRRAVSLAPADPHLRFNLAQGLERIGQGRAAYREYQSALVLDPHFGEAHQQLGAWLFGAGQLDDAIRHLEQAAALLPQSAAVLADLGGALAQSGRLVEAKSRLERAVELDPAHGIARENLARLSILQPK